LNIAPYAADVLSLIASNTREVLSSTPQVTKNKYNRNPNELKKAVSVIPMGLESETQNNYC
jgi:hypothetical protein